MLTEIGHSPSPNPSDAIEVRVARSFAEVEALREFWSAWPSHRDSNIDVCLQVVWVHEQVIRPHVIVVYRRGQPVTMLVGRLERIQVKPKIGYLQLPGVASRALLFSYGGLLGDSSPENSSEIVKSIMGALRDGQADWASFHQLGTELSLYKHALSMPGFFGRDHMATPAAHYCMILPETIEKVYANLSSGHRKHLRSEAKKIHSDFEGRLRIRGFCETSEVEEAIKDAEAIAKKTYQRELGFGFEPTAQVRDSFRFFAEKGWLRIYILYLDEIPAAFSIGSISDGLYCCDFLGFDPRFRKYSPGTFLLTKMLEDFCRAGVARIDFGPGEGSYKERFGNQGLIEASVSIFAPTVKGLVLNSIQTSTGTVDKFSKKLLDRMQVLPKIKKFWRQRAAKAISSSN